jgi:hypothetical protein
VPGVMIQGQDQTMTVTGGGMTGEKGDRKYGSKQTRRLLQQPQLPGLDRCSGAVGYI